MFLMDDNQTALDQYQAANQAANAAREKLRARLAEITKEAEEIKIALGESKPKRIRKTCANAGKPREKKALGKGLKATEASA